jgi:uncharacterized RDD family membrane protein YckC
LASPGIRLAAFVVDSIVANLLAGLPYLFGVSYNAGERGYAVYAAFLLQEFVLVSVTGASIGKHLCGIRVVRAADGGRLAWPWVLARTVLLGLLVPPLIWDRDGRGLHDRAAGSLTLRVGRAAAAPRDATATAARAAAAPAAAAPAPAASQARSGQRPTGTASTTGTAARPAPRRRKKRR